VSRPCQWHDQTQIQIQSRPEKEEREVTLVPPDCRASFGSGKVSNKADRQDSIKSLAKMEAAWSAMMPAAPRPTIRP
jgi:hypothetical protein